MKGAPKVIARTSRASGGRVMDPTRRDLLVSSNGRVRRELEPTVNPWVFVTGMFRSGTTLLAIMLQNHSRLRIPTDPLSNLFKAFRNEVASNLQPDRAIDEHTPLYDYYSRAEKQALLRITALMMNPADSEKTICSRRQTRSTGCVASWSPTGSTRRNTQSRSIFHATIFTSTR